MLTIHLTLSNNQVSVRANGKESHQFSLLDLSQSEQEWKDFYRNPRVYGEKLFNALFRDAAEAEFDALSEQSERTIALVLDIWWQERREKRQSSVISDQLSVNSEQSSVSSEQLSVISEQSPASGDSSVVIGESNETPTPTTTETT